MPKAYSQDLRARVVGHVEAGHSRRTAAVHFGVSVSFVVNLMTAYRLRGSLAPKPLGGRKARQTRPASAVSLASGGGEARHHDAGIGGRPRRLLWRESRSRLALPLAHPQWPKARLEGRFLCIFKESRKLEHSSRPADAGASE